LREKTGFHRHFRAFPGFLRGQKPVKARLGRAKARAHSAFSRHFVRTARGKAGDRTAARGSQRAPVYKEGRGPKRQHSSTFVNIRQHARKHAREHSSTRAGESESMAHAMMRAAELLPRRLMGLRQRFSISRARIAAQRRVPLGARPQDFNILQHGRAHSSITRPNHDAAPRERAAPPGPNAGHGAAYGT
jgi:hypothetical protein